MFHLVQLGLTTFVYGDNRDAVMKVVNDLAMAVDANGAAYMVYVIEDFRQLDTEIELEQALADIIAWGVEENLALRVIEVNPVLV